MYSLFALFLTVPLIFSHFFARLGGDFIIDNGIGNFESVKMQVFFVLISLATIEILYFRWDRFVSRGARFWIFTFSSFLAFLTFSLLYYPYDDIPSLFFGIGEKQHGVLMILGLIWLGILLSFLSSREKRHIGYMILISGSLVAITALIESLGYNIFTGKTYEMRGSWGAIRSTSTLGNPNYVAGFLLMLLPLVYVSIARGEKYILFFLLFLGLVATKSMIGITLGSIYIVFLLGKKLLGPKIYILLPLILIIAFSLAYGLTQESEKWLSLSSRFILMKDLFLSSFDSVMSILFGHGPNSVIEYFDFSRSPEIDAYFPSNLTIDSSHNIFIDIFVKYGLLGIGLISWYLVKKWQYADTRMREVCIFGGIFFSLNVAVLSHFLILIYCLSREEKSRTISG